MGILGDLAGYNTLLQPTGQRGVDLLGFGSDFFDNAIAPATGQVNDFLNALRIPKDDESYTAPPPVPTPAPSPDLLPKTGGGLFGGFNLDSLMPKTAPQLPGLPNFGGGGGSAPLPWADILSGGGSGSFGQMPKISQMSASGGMGSGGWLETLSRIANEKKTQATSSVGSGGIETGGFTLAGPGYADEYGDDLVPYQFGDAELTSAEAYAACGPAALVAFQRLMGRNPSLREAVDIAAQFGWNTGGGMNGMGNTVRMFQAQGIPMEADWSANRNTIIAKLQQGIPVLLSTGRHYYVADRIDNQGRLHVGASGRAIKGGSNWMTLDQIEAQFGGDPIDGAMYFTGERAKPSSGGGGGTNVKDNRKGAKVQAGGLGWTISNEFGGESGYGPHRGLDLYIHGADRFGYGTQYKAFNPGTVANVHTQPGDGGGLIITVKRDDGTFDLYMHNSASHVQIGQRVDQTTILGSVGDSGNEGNAHLHYEVRDAPGGKSLDPWATITTLGGGAPVTGDWQNMDGETRRQSILQMAQQHDGTEFAMIINGVMNLENGLEGAVGDNGNSFGPFQFYTGGKLPGFAAAIGVSVEEAKRLTMDPQLSGRYAFTYLHPVYVRGKQLGLSGPDLLYYVQTKGQVSVPPSAARLNAAWGDSVRRFGG